MGTTKKIKHYGHAGRYRHGNWGEVEGKTISNLPCIHLRLTDSETQDVSQRPPGPATLFLSGHLGRVPKDHYMNNQAPLIEGIATAILKCNSSARLISKSQSNKVDIRCYNFTQRVPKSSRHRKTQEENIPHSIIHTFNLLLVMLPLCSVKVAGFALG